MAKRTYQEKAYLICDRCDKARTDTTFYNFVLDSLRLTLQDIIATAPYSRWLMNEVPIYLNADKQYINITDEGIDPDSIIGIRDEENNYKSIRISPQDADNVDPGRDMEGNEWLWWIQTVHEGSEETRLYFLNRPEGNLLTDGKLDAWDDSTTLTNWTLVGVGASIARTGDADYKRPGSQYSCKLTRVGADAYIYQDISSPDDYDGKTVTIGAWVLSSTASQARILISTTGDAGAITAVASDYHTGSGEWEYLSATVTLDTTLTVLRVSLYNAVAGDVYYDNVSINIAKILKVICAAKVTDPLEAETSVLPAKYESIEIDGALSKVWERLDAESPMSDKYQVRFLGGYTQGGEPTGLCRVVQDARKSSGESDALYGHRPTTGGRPFGPSWPADYNILS